MKLEFEIITTRRDCFVPKNEAQLFHPIGLAGTVRRYCLMPLDFGSLFLIR